MRATDIGERDRQAERAGAGDDEERDDAFERDLRAPGQPRRAR